jgi:hypothetical protein
MHIVAKEKRVLDAVDELAADICSTLKRRGEQFENDDQLRSWLDEDRVRYDPQSFAVALRQLEELGRIRRDHHRAAPEQDRQGRQAALPHPRYPDQDPQQEEAERLKAVHEARVKIVPRV